MAVAEAKATTSLQWRRLSDGGNSGDGENDSNGSDGKSDSDGGESFR